MTKSRQFLRYLSGILLIWLLWSVAALIVNRSGSDWFPSPFITVKRLAALLGGQTIQGKHILSHLGLSLARWLKGYGAAVLIAVPLGILMGYFSAIFEILLPVITFFQIIPGLAWIPIALLMFGLGEGATFFMIFITSFPPLVLNTAGGIREMSPLYLRASGMMGLGRITLFFKVLLPASSLSIVNGLRIALASAWRVLIAAEMIVGSSVGLGYIIIQSRWNLEFPTALAVVLIIAAIGLIVEKVLFQLLENRIRRIMGYEGLK